MKAKFSFNEGIKAFLADLSYSRYIYMINVNLTPFGAQTKFTNDSTGIDRNTIKDLSKQAQIDGNIKFNIIQKYILSKPSVFSRYCKENKKDTGVRSSKNIKTISLILNKNIMNFINKKYIPYYIIAALLLYILMIGKKEVVEVVIPSKTGSVEISDPKPEKEVDTVYIDTTDQTKGFRLVEVENPLNQELLQKYEEGCEGE